MNTRRNRRKTLTNPSDLAVLTKCLDLLKYTFVVSSNDKNIAKKYRLTLVKHIQDVALSAYSYLIRANLIFPKDEESLKKRLAYHDMADENLHVLLSLAEASTQICSMTNPGVWSKLVWEVICLSKAWRKSSIEQFENLMISKQNFGYSLCSSPNVSNSNNARNVNTDGSLSNNNAYNGNNGVRPIESNQVE